MDSLVEEQYTALTECSNFVDEGGQLAYIVPTMSNKESKLLIARFLKEHQDFVLEFERQYFPFDPYDSSLYFALLRKVNKEND
jgi:16S rRNA C967 or C1407 C5-methylase (RsmB/RsmF family)